MATDFITVGTITMTHQAFSVAVVTLVISVAIIGTSLLFGGDTAVAAIIMAILVTGAGFYYAYIVNCTVVGHCDELAWFMLVIFVLNIAVSMLTMTATLKNLVKKQAPNTRHVHP
jgi:hypothetical protein